MGRKEKVIVDKKVAAVKDYLAGTKGVSQICLELQVNKNTVMEWLRKYQLKGELGLQTIKKNKYYPDYIKLQAISDYQEGLGSLNQICSKYDLSNNSILQQWIKKYNGHKKIKSHNSKGDKNNDNSIVSYVLGRSNNNLLVFETFDKAIDANPNASPLFHSDRGFQYTNKSFKKKLDDIGAIQSMSRVGRCIDNGPMEGFWGIIKSEMYYLTRFHNFDELVQSIDEYVDFYNTRRLQEKLKGLTPIEYRSQSLVA